MTLIPPAPATVTDPALVPPAPSRVLRDVARQVTFDTRAEPPDVHEPGRVFHLALSQQEVLPQVEGDDGPPRPWWRKRVFIASLAATLVAGLATGFFVWYQHVNAPLTEVKNLKLIDLGPTYHLSWNGPEETYQVVATNRAGEHPYDASLFIRGGTQAFIPKNTDTLGATTCFVVRSHHVAARHKVSTTDTGLKDQGAQMACVADAR